MKINFKKNISICLLILGFSCVGHAQQETQFTQYMFNRLAVNPGYAGSSGSICASIMYRNQWLGFQLSPPAPGIDAGSTPITYLFSFDAPVKFLHGGLGFTLYSDKIGYYSTFAASFDYAFRIYWGPGNLSAAIEGNLYNSSLKYNMLKGYNDLSGNYVNPLTNSGDPMLTGEEDATDMIIDASTGVYYQVPGTYYFGFSIKNLLAAKSEVLNFTNSRVIYFHGGYEYVIPANSSYRLKPSAMLRMADFSFKTFTFDVSCLLEYQNQFWGGVNFRLDDSFSLLAGVNWDKMKFGFAYDMTLSKLGYTKRGLSKGSLEAYLRYCFKIVIPPKLPSSYQGTRYLL